MMKSSSRWLLWAALIIAIVFWAAAFEFENYLRRPLPIEAVEELEIPRGGNLGQVARELAARGALERPHWLLAYARISGRGHRIQAGEYLIGPGTTPLDLLQMLEIGRVRTYAVTLVEGWTLAQVRAQLAGNERLRRELDGVDDDRLLLALGVDAAPGRHPEGQFFPDTYVFSGRTSDRDVLLQAYRRMQEVLAEEWGARAPGLPYDSPYEALIMASIIERETGVAEERPDIAGVFVRRLRLDMLLQTDPTVIYGMGGQYDGNLRRRDLVDAANPYNTYARRGLPPTPIALPGRAAIHAALNPAAGTTLFFVARGDGSHHFSTTLEEHVRAVKKYQLEQRRADYRSSPAAGGAR
jgi:UPF0755 protein